MTTEEFKVSGSELLAKIKQLVHEGSVRSVLLRDHLQRLRIEQSAARHEFHAIGRHRKRGGKIRHTAAAQHRPRSRLVNKNRLRARVRSV